MDLLLAVFEVLDQFDEKLITLVRDYGEWTYLVLFIIIFCETGLVVTPFLPGDSLLFAAGAIAAAGSFEIAPLLFLLSAAAIAGDAVNYALGNTVASRWLLRSGLLDRRRLDEAARFYERHGGKTIILARFAPFLRTFAPFVAGMARMRYRTFATFNVAGGLAWVAVCTLGGFFFGNVPAVKECFSEALLLLIALSLTPVVAGVLRACRAKREPSYFQVDSP